MLRMLRKIHYRRRDGAGRFAAFCFGTYANLDFRGQPSPVPHSKRRCLNAKKVSQNALLPTSFAPLRYGCPDDPVLCALDGRGGGTGMPIESSLCMAIPPSMPIDDK